MGFSIGESILNHTKTIKNMLVSNNSTILSPIQPEITTLNQGLFVLVGGIFCILAILIAGHQIVLHLHYYHQPNYQLYIVRILLMVPVSLNNFH